MKKFVIVLLALFLVVGGVLGYSYGVKEKAAIPAATAEPDDTVEPTVQVSGLDYEAIYALHEPDEVVMTIGDKSVTWDEYFYYLYHQSQSVESYFSTMAAYGVESSWTDPADEDGTSFADLTIESANATALSLKAMESFAEVNGIELSDADRASIEEKVQADIAAACGEGATREDFDAYLAGLYMPGKLYDQMNELSVLYQQGYIQLYGENGEKLSDEETLAWLEGQDYMAANHILLMTIDPRSYESLDEEAVAAKKAQAEEIAAQLQAIDDNEELMARFAELKEEYDEDTGKIMFPNGYVFLPGSMVAEFENAVKSQDDYQVSDPVLSTYGYHVIVTLPLDPDAVVDYSSNGTAMTARSTAANSLYAQALDDFTLEQEIVPVDGFEAPDLASFVK